MSRAEVLDVGAATPGRSWWARQTPGRRRSVTASAVLIVGLALGGIAVDAVRDSHAERVRRDRVALAVSLDVSADSSAPGGGAVWFAVEVRNDGPLPVRVDGVRGSGAGLVVSLSPASRRRLQRVMPLEPGEATRLIVSARLDCLARAAASASDGRLSGALDATPVSGRRRSVEVAVAQEHLLTDIADTTCRYRQDAAGVELSGPVLRS